ncbi:Acylneuraminate cytidylyltransferase [Candidatus Electrothrix laxa]
MKALAIIPARGGSKGIPEKNIRDLCGKPLIAYSIEAARQARLVDRVVVSTDDQKIANIAIEYGAEVIHRPAELAGDFASSEAALLHALNRLFEQEQYRPDLLVFLQCTSPLTLPSDIDGTVQALLDQGADTAFAAAPFHYFLWSLNVEGEVHGINHDKKNRLMRQQRDNQFVEAGAVYVMRTAGFIEKKHRFFGKTVLYEIPEERCFEIDEPVDLIIAAQLMEIQLKKYDNRS